MSVLIKIVKAAQSAVKSTDLFYSKIELTHKGDSTYKTFFGGATTIVIISLMLWYSINLFIKMMKKEDFAFKQSTYENFLDDSSAKTLNFKSGGVRIAYLWHDDTESTSAIQIDEKYGQIGIISYFVDNTGSELVSDIMYPKSVP